MNIFFIQAISIFFFNNLWFIFAVLKKRNDIADVAWGTGFIIVAFISLFYSFNGKSLIMFALVCLWGFRLSFHILRRYLKKSKEDQRYLDWRIKWGKKWIIFSWLKVFMLQGFFLYLISLPIITTSYGKVSWNFINILGILIWLFGFIYEIIADRQLKNFIIKNKEKETKIMKSGLWRYSRHPNYFGEAVLWWGIWIMTWGSSFCWLNLISPLTITFLLRYVSGVPLAEKEFINNEDFLEYKKKTPPMFPDFFIK